MTTIKHILLSLLMLCNITLAYGKATTQSDSTQAVTLETTAQLKPIDIINNPNILTDKWLTELIPISQYTDEEKKLQTLINDKTATAVKTYSTATQDKEWVKYDHEAITPYTWKIIDIALTEANGKTNNVSLLRPNWWIRNIGADRLGNRFYLKIPEVAEGNAVVKAIRANQLDTRLWDEQRNGDYVYRPITATFQHDSNNVLNLYFNNDVKPLGVTPEHPIYSMDKNKFVHAGDLKIGEKVKTYQGMSTLVRKEKLEGTHKVYNIEVYRDHNYMVSLNSIVVHNNSPAYQQGGTGLSEDVPTTVGNLEPNNPRSTSIDRNGDRLVLYQGDLPTCGPNSCARTMHTLGKEYDLSKLIADSGAIDNGGATLPKLVTTMKNQGVDNASFKAGVSIETLSEATANGNPAIVVVKLDRGNHAVVVDGITTRNGQTVVAIRDSTGLKGTGRQYFTPIEEFKSRFIGQAIIFK